MIFALVFGLAATRIAADDRVVFNETSLIETTGGDLVALVRTAGYQDHGVVVRSTDRGQSWEPWNDMGVIGHPYQALRLDDGCLLLVYGYRHEPYGIRARLLDPEGRDFSGPELVLRTDGGSGDLGYPWACQLADGRVLLTCTQRSTFFPLGVRALLSEDDGRTWAFDSDRIVIDGQGPWGLPQGGGFGNTVQLADGDLLTCYSYRRGPETTRIEVARWRLPD